MNKNRSASSIVILLVLCVFLCSCGTKQGNTNEIPNVPDISTNENAASDSNEVSPSSSPTEDTISESPESDVPDDVPDSLRDISILSVKGEMDASTYINDYFGLACDLNDGWIIWSDKELTAANGLSVNYSDDEMAAQQQRICDQGAYLLLMRATRNNTTEAIDVKISSNLEEISSLSDDEFLDLLYEMTASDDMKQAMINSNPMIQDVRMTINKFDFLGKEYKGILTEMELAANGNTVTTYQQMTLIRKGNYILQILMTSLSSQTLSTLSGYFYPYPAVD